MIISSSLQLSKHTIKHHQDEKNVTKFKSLYGTKNSDNNKQNENCVKGTDRTIISIAELL
jgi:hypothetical protein